MTLATIVYETFEPLEGEIFQLQINETETMPIELVEVKAQGKRALGEKGIPDHIREVPFSLLFKVPPDFYFEQQMVFVSHEKLGEQAEALFLVPVSQEKDGLYYEAIFN